jgi:flagella synthesis protein FlgN
MPASGALGTAIAAALAEEVNQLKAFVSLLQREQALLTEGDTAGLQPLIDNKAQLTTRLTTLAEAREKQLGKLGLPPGRVGMETLLQRCGQGNLNQAWQELITLAGTARELNLTNGKLIGLHMQHNQQTFTALMGATNRAMTYGPDGQQQAGLGGRILGTA